MKGGEYDGKLFWTGMYAGNAGEAILYETGDGNICDLFAIDRDYKSARFMFLHEYIIALLKTEIPFSIEDYYRIEGLAEYYCEELIGKSYNFTNMNKYIDFYRAKMTEKTYSPKELFEAEKGF